MQVLEGDAWGHLDTTTPPRRSSHHPSAPAHTCRRYPP
jgi:hypothetical protein